jgi:DNA-binding FadR family transcriptional regulator
MQDLLLVACDSISTTRKNGKTPVFRTEADVIKQTWKLFDAIARAARRPVLHHTLKQVNDRLAPIRRAKQSLFDDSAAELSALHRLWHARDIPSLKSALCEYHQRRIQMVPQIVALLDESSEFYH